MPDEAATQAASISSTASASADTSSPAGPALVDLPHGKGLNLTEATLITREMLTSVVLFAGTAGSGKTTLLATLYLLFQKGPLAGYEFAGSRTLVGFEERSYFVRTASQRSTPTTERTTVSEMLHIRVRRTGSHDRSSDLLVCDFSGEDFREAKDSSEACRQLPVLRRADHLVLLVDGKKLADPSTRRRARQEPLTLLRNCLDTGVISVDAGVDVLFTKWDLVESSKDRDEIVSFVEHTEAEVRSHFSSRVASLRLARVAAHPTRATLQLGYGLTDLFAEWVESRRRLGVSMPTQRLGSGSTEFDRYRWIPPSPRVRIA